MIGPLVHVLSRVEEELGPTTEQSKFQKNMAVTNVMELPLLRKYAILKNVQVVEYYLQLLLLGFLLNDYNSIIHK